MRAEEILGKKHLIEYTYIIFLTNRLWVLNSTDYTNLFVLHFFEKKECDVRREMERNNAYSREIIRSNSYSEQIKRNNTNNRQMELIAVNFAKHTNKMNFTKENNKSKQLNRGVHIENWDIKLKKVINS